LKAFHAYELALEAQRLVFCMSAMSAVISTFQDPAAGVPLTARVMMKPMSDAIYNAENIKVEENIHEW
jgi:hypothetical protein